MTLQYTICLILAEKEKRAIFNHRVLIGTYELHMQGHSTPVNVH